MQGGQFTQLDNESTASLFYRPTQPLPRSDPTLNSTEAPRSDRQNPFERSKRPAGSPFDANSVTARPSSLAYSDFDPTKEHVPFTSPAPSTSHPLRPSLSRSTVASYSMATTGGNPVGGTTYPPYDAERAAPAYASSSSHTHHEKPLDPQNLTGAKRPGSSRTPSWDMLGGIKKLEQSYEQFDTRNASQAHLVYADGDMPKNKVSKFYHFLLNVSIVTRWILFIVPVLGIIWIPGILSITKFPNARVWSVKLIWWSIWLSVLWGGWWAALAASRIIPSIVRATVGVVAVGTRRYIEWMQVLHRYIALFAWSLALWISWGPLIKSHRQDPSPRSVSATDLIERLLFALFICSAVLLFEKFSIQWIAGKFHERSYAERIADQKFAVKALVTLYRFSSNTPGRTDVLSEEPEEKGSFVNPKRVFKKITKGVRMAATTTTTALGNVASEIAGSSVLQPNSPQAIVKTALESANKSRLLARRLFYSFSKQGAEYMLVDDIRRYFATPEEAEQVFALFDKDGNGDASREEVEIALMEFHREQLSIENSMRDLDSAVGRLDNIFMSLYVVIAALIIAVALEAQLLALVTGAGTLILGLSWLIGGSLQEVLTSIIFLFIKHPYDVGDRVIINKETYTVKEIRLLSTVFLDSSSTCVQAPNNQINTQFIQNLRRSPQMSETFVFDVHYSTSFEDIERLREKMLAFVTEERRDYHPAFDVNIKDFPEQSKMTLSADIKYKSNAQIASLKMKRRNKWICALKQALADVKIFGPGGDPNPAPGVTRYTQIPWETIQYEDQKAQAEKEAKERDAATSQPHPSQYSLGNKNAAILDPSSDVFGDGSEMYASTPFQELPQNPLHQRHQQAHAQAAAHSGMPAPSLGTSTATATGGILHPHHQLPHPQTQQQQQQPFGAGDSFEMTPRR